MTKQLKYIYFFSFSPLLLGSFIFFYWFYQRTWFASDVNIELPAFFAIVWFLLSALITLFICLTYVFTNPADWKKMIVPVLIVAATIPAIDLYGTLHTSLSEQAFVRIINDSDKKIERIWSANFEMTYFKEKGNDFILSYHPVYTYNWAQEYSSGMFNYEINKVQISLKDQDAGPAMSYNLPELPKGACATIRLTEIMGVENK